jgi:hypothetical protein
MGRPRGAPEIDSDDHGNTDEFGGVSESYEKTENSGGTFDD